MANDESDDYGDTASARTDFRRWSNPQSLDPQWSGRAKLAATYIPTGARVLDLGCGAMDLERYLPDGCSYQPCDLVARDERTIVCNFNAGEFPQGVECDVVTALGVMECLTDVPDFLAKVRALRRPAVLSYSMVMDSPDYPRGPGWINHYTQAEILQLIREAGFEHHIGMEIENGQILLKADPEIPLPRYMLADEQAELARLAARMVPAYAKVLGAGEGSDRLEAVLPIGCSFHSAELLPQETAADILVILDPNAGSAADVAATAERFKGPIVCAWTFSDEGDATLLALQEAMSHAGFGLQRTQRVSPTIGLLKWVQDVGRVQGAAGRRVLVMSYYNTANFGDRLGYHVLNSLLPANVEVAYGSIYPWVVPDRDYDLLILGIGNSLLPRDLCMPELASLLTKVPQSIGIFGTQFREQFGDPAIAGALDSLLERLTTWWARYEEDVLAFGRGRSNVRHLGDWLVSAFPLGRPVSDKGLAIPPEIIGEEVALDRMIQKIQSYQGVSSARLHPLLCALTSAHDVSYQEQRIEGYPDWASGKFRSLLYDIFGQTFEEGELFPVDRDAVVRYKMKVQSNMENLRVELLALLGGGSAT